MRSPPSASTSATAPTAAPPETPNSPHTAAIPPQRAPPPTPDSQPPTPHSTPPPHSGYRAQLSGKQSHLTPSYMRNFRRAGRKFFARGSRVPGGPGVLEKQARQDQNGLYIIPVIRLCHINQYLASAFGRCPTWCPV